MERKLSLSFDFVLFWCKNGVTLSLNSLSQKFLNTLSSEDLLKCRLALPNETKSESAKSNLNHGTVVEDLSSNIGTTDRILKMRHEEHITSGVVLIVEGVVVDVGKHCSRAKKGVVLLVKVNAKSTNEGEGGEVRRVGCSSFRGPDSRGEG